MSALDYRIVGTRGTRGCIEVGPTFLHGERGESLACGREGMTSAGHSQSL